MGLAETPSSAPFAITPHPSLVMSPKVMALQTGIWSKFWCLPPQPSPSLPPGAAGDIAVPPLPSPSAPTDHGWPQPRRGSDERGGDAAVRCHREPCPGADLAQGRQPRARGGGGWPTGEVATTGGSPWGHPSRRTLWFLVLAFPKNKTQQLLELSRRGVAQIYPCIWSMGTQTCSALLPATWKSQGVPTM